MSSNQDIRWIQRLNNFNKALENLGNDIELATSRELSDIERRGLIQAFEFTYELSWNVIKDFYQELGETNIQGSRDAFKIAFQRGLVSSEVLVQTIASRQKTSHSYDEETAKMIYHEIVDKYYDAFKELADSLEKQKAQRGL